ncbi:MAG: alpha/beta hydrolase [Pseudomonadota bacterium]
MFADFTKSVTRVGDVDIAYVMGGSGPPVLMLHGFPQTMALWAQVAPALARDHTVICADLRGYGASSKPDPGPDAEPYTFRAMAQDQVALMEGLGFPRFHLVGHDRGARVAYRLALDHPDAVQSLTLMDIVRTDVVLGDIRRDVALAYYHWFYLAQPGGLPERMIGQDPDAYFESCLLGWGGTTLDDFAPDQLTAYRAAWRHPDTIRGMCADYRAAATLDVVQDEGDAARVLDMPALVLYGAEGVMAQSYDVPATWSPRLSRMHAEAIPGGHFFVDTAPEATTAAVRMFLTSLAGNAC